MYPPFNELSTSAIGDESVSGRATISGLAQVVLNATADGISGVSLSDATTERLLQICVLIAGV